MTYRVEHYGPEGHNGPADDFVVAEKPTLAEARAAVRRYYGLRALRRERRWYPADCVEGYHELTLSQPGACGCAGVVVVEIRR